jgi:hypothetical protein
VAGKSSKPLFSHILPKIALSVRMCCLGCPEVEGEVRMWEFEFHHAIGFTSRENLHVLEKSPSHGGEGVAMGVW